MAAGCSGGYSSSPRYTQEETKPFPEEKLTEAKNLMDKGALLFKQALNADTQQEKTTLAREAREKYYFPAQDKLDRLKEDYPDNSYEIDRVYQELNRRILDATRMDGIGG